MVCEIDSFIVHCEDSSKWIGASKPIKPLHRIIGNGCVYCCMETHIEKLHTELAEKDKAIAEAESLVEKLIGYILSYEGEFNTCSMSINDMKEAGNWIEKYGKQKDEVKSE